MSPGVNPLEGKSCPVGGENLNSLPPGSVKESVIGLKESFPENDIAVTIVGEARKFIVCRLPSLRDLKFLLKLVRIATRKESDVMGLEMSLQAHRFPRPSCLLVSTRTTGQLSRNRVPNGGTYLTDAWATSVRQNNRTDLLEVSRDTIAFHGCAYLF